MIVAFAIIRKIKLILSARNLNYKQGNNVSIWPGAVLLVSFIFAVIFIIPNFSSVTGDEWWSKFIIGFVISFVITLYKDELKNLALGRVKPSSAEASQFFNFIFNFILKFSIFIIICLSLGICFDLFNIIYCDETDSETETDTEKEENNKKSQNKGKDDDQKKDSSQNENSYNYTGSVEKGIVKEVLDGVFEVIGKVIQNIAGAAAGAKLGSAIIKSSPGLS